jgi:hypothetical protein
LVILDAKPGPEEFAALAELKKPLLHQAFSGNF